MVQDPECLSAAAVRDGERREWGVWWGATEVGQVRAGWASLKCPGGGQKGHSDAGNGHALWLFPGSSVRGYSAPTSTLNDLAGS